MKNDNWKIYQIHGGGGSYTYDGEGRRVMRVTAGQTWWYVYGINGELLAEYQSGAVRKEYGYRGGQLLVVWDNDKVGNERLKWLFSCGVRRPGVAMVVLLRVQFNAAFR